MIRTNIPGNRVSIDYERVIKSFIQLIVEKQNENLRSIFLTGSYSRGDAVDSSDLDLWLVFNSIDCKVLNDVGMTVREMRDANMQLEINSQCLSIDEFKSVYFAGWTERPVKVLESVLLFGEDLIGANVSVPEIETIYKKYLVEVLLSIRHYICVDESVEKLTYQKVRTYILKPLMFPLRLERWCTCGSYPLSNADLRNAYDKPISELVDYFLDQDKFESEIRQQPKEVLYKLHDWVVALIK